jgi:hypothetical protein
MCSAFYVTSNGKDRPDDPHRDSVMTSISFYYVIKLDVIHFRDTDRLYRVSRPYEKMLIYMVWYGATA